jgi:hypothetical protein
MEQAQGRAFRTFGLLILVLGGHVLLLGLLLRGGPWETHEGPARTESPVPVLLNLESPLQQPRTEHTPEKVGRTRSHRPRESSGAAPSEPSGESTAISPETAPVIPSTDWQRELEIAVERLTPGLIKEYTRVCAQAERIHAPRPPGCPRRSYDGPWRPSGNLLQDMLDPDRPQSSVPDPLPEAFPKAPRSEVFQNDH